MIFYPERIFEQMGNLIEFENKIINPISDHVLAEWKNNNLYTYFISNHPIPFEWLVQIGEWVNKTKPTKKYKISKVFDSKPIVSFCDGKSIEYHIDTCDCMDDGIEEYWE